MLGLVPQSMSVVFRRPHTCVMAGLVPAIYVLFVAPPKGVDARDKRGHDDSIETHRTLISNGTAVDIDRLTGDELAGVGGQKKRGAA
jgi:hypothetical protein